MTVCSLVGFCYYQDMDRSLQFCVDFFQFQLRSLLLQEPQTFDDLHRLVNQLLDLQEEFNRVLDIAEDYSNNNLQDS